MKAKTGRSAATQPAGHKKMPALAGSITMTSVIIG